jgi:signal transduction histidine kinase
MLSRIEKALLVSFAAVAAVYLLLPTSLRGLAGHVALFTAPAAGALLAVRAARRGARGAIPVWVLLSLAAGAVAMAQALWAYRELIQHQPMPFPSASYYFFIAFHPLFAAALVVSLRDRGRIYSRAELVQDGLLATAAIALVLLRFVYEPLAASRPWLNAAELGWIVGGQFLAHLSLVAAVLVVIWRRTVLPPRAAAALVLVAVVNGTAHMLQIAGLNPNPGTTGSLFDLIWVAGWMMFAAAGAAGGSPRASAWTSRTAVCLSTHLQASLAPIMALVLTVIIVHVSMAGQPASPTIAMLGVLGCLLALRLAGTLGAAEREQRKQQELTRTRTLVELSRTLATAPRVSGALAHVAEAAKKLLGAEHVWFELSDEHARTTQRAVPEGATAADGSCARWLAAQRVAQQLTGTGPAVYGPDGLLLPSRVWLAGAVLRFGNRVAGALAIHRSGRGFDQGELDLLGALADQAAVTIDNARLVEEARQAERNRLRNEKLAGLGQLAAGVAHEINNPLAAIHSAAATLSAEIMGDEHRDVVDIIRLESARAARIVRGMLDFVHPPQLSVQPVDLAELIQQVVAGRAAAHDAAGISTHVCLDQLPPVLADRGRIEQVLLNVITNAEHALLSTAGERTLTLSGATEQECVAIHIRDTGIGIAADNIARVFEPFFTTKPVGQGTGLGLSMSYGILHDLGGSIAVDSEPGAGATFTLRLPRAEDTGGVPHEAAPPAHHADPGQPLSILLVDDEASIRHLVARFLRRCGHAVETAENGQAAFDLTQEHEFHVILTDMKMPVLDGEALYTMLRRTNPALAARMIFVTGDTVADSTREFLLGTGQPFFSKPFDLTDLAVCIADFSRT